MSKKFFTIHEYRFTVRGYNQGEMVLKHRTDSEQVCHAKLLAFIKKCEKVVLLESVRENGEYHVETEVF